MHLAPYTTSNIISKSISFGGGISTYRGLLKIVKGAKGSVSHVQCDALMPDNISVSNTIPIHQGQRGGRDARPRGQGRPHLRGAGVLSDEPRSYRAGRPSIWVVQGFMEPIAKSLPLEYAVELNPPHRHGNGRLGKNPFGCTPFMLKQNRGNHHSCERGR